MGNNKTNRVYKAVGSNKRSDLVKHLQSKGLRKFEGFGWCLPDRVSFARSNGLISSKGKIWGFTRKATELATSLWSIISYLQGDLDNCPIHGVDSAKNEFKGF